MKRSLKIVICFMFVLSMIAPIHANNDGNQAISKKLYVTRLAQHNKEWKDIQLGTCTKGQTIGSHGSALVAYTMVYNFHNNTLDKPAKVNSEMREYCNLQWNKLSSISVSNQDFKVTNEELFDLAEKYISLDLPVILQIRKYEPNSKYANTVGYRYHYVVVNGYNKTDMSIQIKDPGANNYSSFKQMQEEGWEADRYYVMKLN